MDESWRGRGSAADDAAQIRSRGAAGTSYIRRELQRPSRADTSTTAASTAAAAADDVELMPRQRQLLMIMLQPFLMMH